MVCLSYSIVYVYSHFCSNLALDCNNLIDFCVAGQQPEVLLVETALPGLFCL